MDTASLHEIGQQLEAIRRGMVETERRFFASQPGVPEGRRDSAANLLHYLALRHHDLRHLQRQLHGFGLSSLGRAESQVLPQVDAMLRLLGRIKAVGEEWGRDGLANGLDGRARLEQRTRELFGDVPTGRTTRIMVTVPTEAADDPRLMLDLVTSGMDCLRINTAHDDERTWERMLENLARARRQTGRGCRLLMDLAGPRLRTGALESGPPVIRWRPERDVYGRVIRAARIWLTDVDRPVGAPAPAAASLPVGGRWLATLRVGDVVRLRDARDKKRDMTIMELGTGGVWAESDQTAYVVPGIRMRRTHADTDVRDTSVGNLPPTARAVVLRPGDRLTVTRSSAAGRPAVLDGAGAVLQPAVIGSSLPSLIDDARPGQRIWFDDGRIGGTIQEVEHECLRVEIVHADPDGSKLGPEKGINVPDTELRLPSLTATDLQRLPFIAAHADIIGYSFVRTAADVVALQSHLAAVSGDRLGLILKIETKRAFEELPSLLLAAMRSPASGVMIARGDLAVECGFERLAEVQEEILWMAEASHTPVIWATQVLEHLAKDGQPSRAEITDAAMGERAECVMLNKGPHVTNAVRTLDDILTRMQQHQEKKSSRLRPLSVADRFLRGLSPEPLPSATDLVYDRSSLLSGS